MATIIQSFWHGSSLTPYEWMCMKSFVDCGHEFQLHTYASDLEVPPGVVTFDASETLPQDKVFLLNNGAGRGSLAIFSDWFRYELILRRGGWWVDTDVVCLTRGLPEQDFFFAFEKPERVNCAIMHFPAGHDVMRRCRDAVVRLGTDVTWASTGPHLLTAMLTEAKMLHHAAPSGACYPFDWTEVPALYDPACRGELTQRTQHAIMVHLWNEMGRRAGLNKLIGVPSGSYLDELFKRHATSFPLRPLYTPAEIRTLDINRCAVEDLPFVRRRLEYVEKQLRDRDREIELLNERIRIGLNTGGYRRSSTV